MSTPLSRLAVACVGVESYFIIILIMNNYEKNKLTALKNLQIDN